MLSKLWNCNMMLNICVNFFDTVLVMTGIELNFFIAACMGLCLGCVMKTVMISLEYFIYSFLGSAYTASRSSLLLKLIRYQGDWGCAKSCEENNLN